MKIILSSFIIILSVITIYNYVQLNYVFASTHNFTTEFNNHEIFGSSLKILTYLDSNANGIFDSKEHTIPNMTIRIIYDQYPKDKIFEDTIIKELQSDRDGKIIISSTDRNNNFTNEILKIKAIGDDKYYLSIPNSKLISINGKETILESANYSNIFEIILPNDYNKNNSKIKRIIENNTEFLQVTIGFVPRLVHGAIIDGFIYTDQNFNGIKDDSEKGLSRIPITVFEEISGNKYAHKITNISTTDGYFIINGIVPKNNSHKLEIESNVFQNKNNSPLFLDPKKSTINDKSVFSNYLDNKNSVELLQDKSRSIKNNNSLASNLVSLNINIVDEEGARINGTEIKFIDVDTADLVDDSYYNSKSNSSFSINWYQNHTVIAILDVMNLPYQQPYIAFDPDRNGVYNFYDAQINRNNHIFSYDEVLNHDKDFVFTLENVSNNHTIILKSPMNKSVMGQIINEKNHYISGIKVDVYNKINQKDEKNVSTVTDKDGKFNVTIFGNSGEIQAANEKYVIEKQQFILDEKNNKLVLKAKFFPIYKISAEVFTTMTDGSHKHLTSNDLNYKITDIRGKYDYVFNSGSEAVMFRGNPNDQITVCVDPDNSSIEPLCQNILLSNSEDIKLVFRHVDSGEKTKDYGKIDSTSIEDQSNNNSLPSTMNQNITYTGNKTITLYGNDIDNDTVKFVIIEYPINGEIYNFNSSLGQFIYIPNLNFNGVDRLSFIATDGKSNSTKSYVYITVDQKKVTDSYHSTNSLPIANAGDDIRTISNLKVFLNGSLSLDPDKKNNIVNYYWKQIDKNSIKVDLLNSDKPISSFIAPMVNDTTILQFDLVVENTQGIRSYPNTVTVIVDKPNSIPIANSGFDAVVTESSKIILNGSGYDKDSDDKLTYTWKQISGKNIGSFDITSQNPQIIVPKYDNFSRVLGFQLIVSDGKNNSKPDYLNLIIEPRIINKVDIVHNLDSDNNKNNNICVPVLDITGDYCIFENKTKIQKPLLDKDKNDDSTIISNTFTNFVEYTSQELGISLQYPSEWTQNKIKEGIQFVKSKDEVYFEIRLNHLDENLNLEQYKDEYITDRMNSRSNFNLLKMESYTISDNIPAVKALYTFSNIENPDKTIKVLRVLSVVGNNAYAIAYVSNPNEYQTDLPLAEEIIRSIKIETP